jgi:predicted GNAT family acetyltransferase
MIRAKGDKIVPRCEFMRGYIGRHPEYADLVVK